MKRNVLLRAPLLTNSGYGVHSRQVFDWLYKREDVDLTVECLQWGRTSWKLNQEDDNGIIEKIMACSKPVQEKYDVTFQVQLPDEWDPNLGKINIGITALVETDKCSHEWVEKCNQMDTIIVPSKFTKNVLKRSGLLTKPVIVIQEWFDKGITNKSLNSITLNEERFKQIDNDFNILMIGTLTSQIPEDDRKNLAQTIKWLCEEFEGDEKVGLVLKTNFGKGTSIDKKLTLDYLKELIQNVRRGEFPKIKLLHGNMKTHEINALYSHPKIKVYASATRGEGYGLPLIEAAASGLPIVVTGWSGHLEFLDRELISPVDYELVELGKTRIDNRIFKEGFKWANPKEESFKNSIRSVYDDYKLAKDKARKLQKNVLENFNYVKISKEYDKVLNEMLEK